MTEAPRQNLSESMQPQRINVRAEAVLALHLVALRRQFDVIRAVFGDDPPHRAREALWAMLEITSADLHGGPIALRDLVIRAEGLLSGPTLSRVVADLERSGLLASDAAPEDSRVKRLRPTARTLEILMTRADAAFTEFAVTLRKAEQAST